MEQNLDPGPVDKSVLVEQELHKSEAISIGKVYKPIRFIEHGTRLNQWEVKHEGMLATLKQAGFYHLSFLKRVQLDHALLNALVERWRRETQTFHLRFGEMTVLLKDVAILTGLRVHGTPITGPTDCHWEQLCLELLGQKPPQIKGGSINIAWLHWTFKNLPEGANQSDIEYATRAYILYQIGCSLFPDPSGTRVHLRYLSLLRDFDASGKMAWGAAVLAHLYRELGKASMKGKANCCAFLTLLQIWAWEHIQIGRPEQLENKTLHNYQPLGCRWNVPFKNRENVRSMDHEFYRHGLDTISDYQITWDPYTPSLIGGLPALCTIGSAVWRSRTPLICFQIVEMHLPDRVLLQLGLIQHIPDPVEAVERVTMQGKADEDWSTYHDKYIKQWENRLCTVVEQQDTGNSNPSQARNRYLDWYWQITRRWISTPVECPVISYELSGHSERVLVDLLSTVQGRIRTLLSGEIDGKRVKESLNDIDIYITAEMKKAKQFSLTSCSNEPKHIKYKRQHMALPSASQNVMQIVAPTATVNEIVKSATCCSCVDPIQATVAKLEQVNDDNVEGNTILQLDQMKRIQPAGVTPDLELPLKGDGTNVQTEDLHRQEDPLDVSMTEVNLQDIISTPVEDDMTDIMSTSADNPRMGSTNAEMKNEKVHSLTSYVSGESVEVLEAAEPTDNNKRHKTATAGSQESVNASLINGTVEASSVSVKNNYTEITHMDIDKAENQGNVTKPSDGPGFYKVMGESSHNGQLQVICAAFEKDHRTEDSLNMQNEDSIGPGTMSKPLNTTGLGDTLNKSVNRLRSKQGDAESPSSSEKEKPAATSGCNERQDPVLSPLKHNVVRDKVGPLQNSILVRDVDDQIENSIVDPQVVQKSVVMPTEVLCITVGEKLVNSSTGEAANTLMDDSGDGRRGSPEQNGSPKRRKLAIPTHGNGKAPVTTEVTNMDGHAKTEKKLLRPQVIAFTRRKKKKPLMHPSS